MANDSSEHTHSPQLVALCYGVLGLPEGASRSRVLLAYAELQQAYEAKAEAGAANVGEDLRHITWAKNTLLQHIAEMEASAEQQGSSGEVPGKGPGTPARPSAEPLFEPRKRRTPWWLSSVIILVLAIIASILYYHYQAKHPGQNSQVGIEIPQGEQSASHAQSGEPGKTTTLAEADVPADLAQLLQQVKKSVVTLQFGQAIGSGFLVSSDGHIVTNAHVVNGRKGIVQFAGGDQAEVNVIKVEPDQDFALLKTATGSNFPYLALGDSNACREGDTVIAIGSPFNYQSSFTKGIVSAKGRRFPHLSVSLIQTDAAINEGNSGGPLINMAGEVVGINTLKIKIVAEGLNFAIAINEVKNLITEGMKTTESERIRDAQNIDAKIAQQRQREGDVDQETRERIAKAQREGDRRYKEEVEEMRKRLEEAKQRQNLQTCISEVNKRIDDMWSEECRAGGMPSDCRLLAFAANRFWSARLQGQLDCMKVFSE